MRYIQVAISEELEPVLAKQMREHRFRSEGDLFVALLKELGQLGRRELDASLLEAMDELDRGKGVLVTPEYWQSLREEIRTKYGVAEQA